MLFLATTKLVLELNEISNYIFRWLLNRGFISSIIVTNNKFQTLITSHLKEGV